MAQNILSALAAYLLLVAITVAGAIQYVATGIENHLVAPVFCLILMVMVLAILARRIINDEV